jgi:hypothetical protein
VLSLLQSKFVTCSGTISEGEEMRSEVKALRQVRPLPTGAFTATPAYRSPIEPGVGCENCRLEHERVNRPGASA